MQPKSTRGVQQVDVNFAADALLAEGARPTVERVRMKLGRGSPNTVGPLLENWFAGLAERLGVPTGPGAEGEDAPPPALHQALLDLWAQAVAKARSDAAAAMQEQQEQLARDTTALQLAHAVLQRQEAAMAERGAALEQALELAKTQIKEQTAQIEATGRQLAQARASLARLVEERDADRRRFDAQSEAASQERERLQAREQGTERRLLEEVDRARQDAKQARRELADAQRRYEKDHNELAQASQALGGRFQDAQIEIAALRERLTATENRAADLQATLDTRRTDSIQSRRASAKPVAAKKARAVPTPGDKRATTKSQLGAAARASRGGR